MYNSTAYTSTAESRVENSAQVSSCQLKCVDGSTLGNIFTKIDEKP